MLIHWIVQLISFMLIHWIVQSISLMIVYWIVIDPMDKGYPALEQLGPDSYRAGKSWGGSGEKMLASYSL